MKRTRISLIITAAAALTLFLGSCAEGPVGIFASVAAETDINRLATKEFRGTSPSFVAKLNVSGTNYYYAGIGGLYRRTIGATSWDKVDTSAAGSSNYVATSGVSDGSTLYVTFANPSSQQVVGVFSFDGSTWDQIDAGFPGEKIRHVLLADDGELFAVTAIETLDNGVVTKTEHKVYRFDGTTPFDHVNTGGAAPSEIGLANALTLAGSTYWFSAGTSTLSGDTSTLTRVPHSIQFGGVFAIGTNAFFTGRDGNIYDATGANPSGVFKDYNDRPYSFSIPVIVNPPSGPSTLLVPSRAYPQGTVRDQGLGYLEFDAASFDTDSAAIADKSRRISTLNNYFITLDGKSVKQILAFEEGAPGIHNRLFALTDGDGLWSNQWQGSSWSGWRRE